MTANAESRRPLIGIFGTFDVENYGDLLFPLLAAQRLGDLPADIVPVSPTGTATRFADAPPPVSVDRFAREAVPAGVLIGGGNIVHLRDVGLAAYADVPGHVAYPSLWMGATLLGAVHRCPVVWNAPGVLTLKPDEAPPALLASTLAGASYLALRDQSSADLLAPFAPQSPIIVPDTALDLDRVWPRDRLARTFGGLLADKGIAGAPEMLAVHVKARSLGGLPVGTFAARLGALSRQLGLMPVLLAIGRVHGDQEVVRAISEALDVPHLALDAPDRLEDVASVLACSRAAMVASLHGFITATAYGTPAALVAVPGLPKFRGFAEQVMRSDDVVDDWEGAFVRLAALAHAGWPAPPQPAAARQRLERHWQEIRRILTPAAERGGTDDLAIALAGAACATGGLAALLATALPRP